MAIRNSEVFLFLMHIVFHIITNKHNLNIFGNKLKSLHYNGSSPLSYE